MRLHGQTKLGFFPLPVAEAKRLRNWLSFRKDSLRWIPGVGLSRTHLSLAQSGRRAVIRDFPVAIGEMREGTERTFHRFARVHLTDRPARNTGRS